MNYFGRIKQEWLKEVDRVQGHPWMKRLNSGEIELCHYIGYLQETYHNTGKNPQLQAFASYFLKDNPREVIKKFYRHAISEVGHDLLALDDLVALGVDRKSVIGSKPLPATEAFHAFFVQKIQNVSPLYYLGYLFHLEFSPTTNGAKYIEMLTSRGIPENALTFLTEHATVDIAHNKLMEDYIEQLVKTDDDFETVVTAIKNAVDLHTLVLISSFENGERLYANRKAA